MDELKEFARNVADFYGIPRELFLGYFETESGWNPHAVNPKSGAAGLGQIMPNNPWAKELGVEGDLRFDPYANILAIGYEMAHKYGKTGDWRKAVTATGEGTPAYQKKVEKAALKYAEEELTRQLEGLLEALNREIEGLSKMTPEAIAVPEAQFAKEPLELPKVPPTPPDTETEMPPEARFGREPLVSGLPKLSLAEAFKRRAEEVVKTLEVPGEELPPEVAPGEAGMTVGGAGPLEAVGAATGGLFLPVSAARDFLTEYLKQEVPPLAEKLKLGFTLAPEIPETAQTVEVTTTGADLLGNAGEAMVLGAYGKLLGKLVDLPTSIATMGFSRQDIIEAAARASAVPLEAELAAVAAERQDLIGRLAKVLDEAEATGKVNIDEIVQSAKTAAPRDVELAERMIRGEPPRPTIEPPATPATPPIGAPPPEVPSTPTPAPARPLPPQHAIANSIVEYVEQGIDPKEALARVSGELNLPPKEVMYYLNADPAEVRAIGTVQAARLGDEVIPNEFKAAIRALVPERQPVSPTEVPKPFMFTKGAISKEAPWPVRKSDLLPTEPYFRSPSIMGSAVFGSSNNHAVDFATAQISFLHNRNTYQNWLLQLVKHYDLEQDIVGSLKDYASRMKPVLEAYRRGEIEAKDLTKAARDITWQLAPIYRNVRIKLAAQNYKKALELCDAKDLELVKLTRQYYDLKKEQMKKLGMRVIEKNYANHYWGMVEEALKENDRGLLTYIDPLWWPGKRWSIPEIMQFARRKGATDLFPLWFQSLQAYIPTVERKLAFNEVLKKWKPHTEELARRGYPNLAAAIREFFDANLGPQAEGRLEQALGALVGSEYFVTTFANASIPLLHLFKVLQTPAWHGFTPYLKAVARLASAVKDEEVRRFLGTYVTMSQLMRTVEQSMGTRNSRFMQPEFWRRLPEQLRKTGLGPVALVEWFDNGVNILAALDRGIRAGVEKPLLHRELIDTMLRLNFRGFDQPRLFRLGGKQVGRFFTMYQMTPYKLMENKADLLMRALTGKRDAFGGSDIAKLVRLAVVLGIPWAIAKRYGIDLTKHVFHPPFTSVAWRSGEPGVTQPPPIQLWSRMSEEGVIEALKREPLRHLAVPTKLARIASGDIPRQYEGPVTYFLGLPKVGWKDELKARARWRDWRKRKWRREPPVLKFLEEIWED